MRKLAVLLLVLAGMGAVGTGMKYLSIAEFTPVHAAIAGRNWSQLDPGVQALILGMLRVMGAGFLGGGVALLSLAYGVGKRERWPAWAALLISGSVWGPTLHVAQSYRAANPGLETPVGITALLLLTVAAASAITWIVNDPARLQAPDLPAAQAGTASPSS